VKKNQVIMRRSAAKMWLLGLAGIPMLIIAVEYIWRPFGFADKLGEWAYRGGDVEAFEIRDDVLIGALALVGTLFVIISVKELLAPRKMVVANEAGMKFALSGPLKKPSEASWLQIKDLVAGDDSMIVQLHHRGELPDDPWGARWVDDSTLEIRASMWERVPEKFINQIADLGLPTAVRAQAIEEETLRNLDRWSGDLVAPPPAPLPVAEPEPEDPGEPETVTDPVADAPLDQIEPASVTLAPPPPATAATEVIEEAEQFEEPPTPQPEETPDTPTDTL
jgi:hypothetical protein